MDVQDPDVSEQQWPQVVTDAILAAQAAYGERSLARSTLEEERQDALTATFRAAWQRGRVKRWLEAILDVADSQQEIAHTLMVKPASVSSWLSGSKGLQPHNAELLRRHFWPRLAADKIPCETDVDCAGYRNAASECEAGGKLSERQQMSVLEFWTLWHLLRTAGWLLAKRSGHAERIAQTEAVLRRSVDRSLLRMGHNPFCGDADSWRRHCEITHRRWAVGWALTVAALDQKCWTPFS